MVRRATLDLEMSVSSIEALRIVRQLSEEAGWNVERTEGSRLVDRFAIIMPMAQATRTLGLKVITGPLAGLEFTTWSETKGSAGSLYISSWLIPGGHTQPLASNLLQHWVTRMSRCPWKWTFGERSSIGYLLPVWKKSKKKFASIGFDTSSKSWPIRVNSSWLSVKSEEE